MLDIKNVLKKYNKLAPFEDLELVDPNQIGIGEDAPIHIACRLGEINDIRVMVSAGANINLKGDIGNTPLHEAVSGGHSLVVETLVNFGALLEVKNEFGQTPRDIAELKQYHGIVAILDKAIGSSRDNISNCKGQ